MGVRGGRRREIGKGRLDVLQTRVKQAAVSLEEIGDLNRMLAMPKEFHEIVKGKRRPIQEHFGRGMFPIVPEFDTGFGPITIQRLATAIIERDRLRENVRHFYRFAPKRKWLEKRDRREPDEGVVDETVIRFMLYDYGCLVNFRMPYKRLLAEVGKGSPGALFKLVKVDKTFLVGPYGASLIVLKQHEGDWKFFEELGKAVAAKPVDEPPYLFKAKLICAYLWDGDLARASYREMVSALEDAGVLGRGIDPRTFGKMLNRVGLKRKQYNRK